MRTDADTLGIRSNSRAEAKRDCILAFRFGRQNAKQIYRTGYRERPNMVPEARHKLEGERSPAPSVDGVRLTKPVLFRADAIPNGSAIGDERQ